MTNVHDNNPKCSDSYSYNVSVHVNPELYRTNATAQSPCTRMYIPKSQAYTHPVPLFTCTGRYPKAERASIWPVIVYISLSLPTSLN